MENEEDRKKEQQEIERLRQKQIEEAKRKLIKENEITKKIINGEKENVKTLKQVSKDDMLKDIALGVTFPIDPLTDITLKATTIIADNVKNINKPKK